MTLTTETLKKKNSRFNSNINGKILRHEGKVYRLIVQSVGRINFAQAEDVHNSQNIVDLFGRSPLAKILKDMVEKGLMS